MTLLAPVAPRTSLLVVLVFLASLALVGKRLLVLVTRYVSGRSISRFSPSRVLLLFFHKPVPLETPRIDLPGPCGWL